MYSASKILNFRSLPVPAQYRRENAKYLSCMELLDRVISEEDRTTLQTNNNLSITDSFVLGTHLEKECMAKLLTLKGRREAAKQTVGS
jgi:hypothetical protein